jgi:catechol 2,3-dioxygenase-like lactoylglutathione lyase family enzyme
MTLFYYKDLEAASAFYDSIGFTLAVDLDWWKVFSVVGGFYLGLVGGDIVPEGINSKKAVKLIVMVDDVDAWFNKLKGLGLKLDHEEVYSSSRLNLREFSLSDPEGYSIEFGQFLSPLGV